MKLSWSIDPLLSAGAAALVIILMMRRTRNLLKGLTLSAVSGAASLWLVGLTSFLTGVTLPVNLFTLLTCLVLGAPGVISLLLMKLFWL